MNILITNRCIYARYGTETFVRDLALKLRGLGHYPMVYSARIGNDIAVEIRNLGIPVVSDINDLPRKPDVIHGHHHIQTVGAFLGFPGVPGIFVCHDRLSKHDVPPLYERIYFYVAVDYNCRERLVDSGIPEEKIKVIYNSVDTDRFLPRPPLPSCPKRALVFSNSASLSTYLRPIVNACEKMNIQLDVAGELSHKVVDHPEKILGRYDLVFAKARCAMEAMATGAAVILCDIRGLGPMVTIDEVEKLRLWNFGMRCLKQPVKEPDVIKQIKRYDPEDAKAVSNYMREKAALSNMAKEYSDLYRNIISAAGAKKSEGSDEFKKYVNALVGQVEKSELILSSYKVTHPKQAIRRDFMQLLRHPRKTLKKIISRKRPRLDKLLGGNVLFDSTIDYNYRFRNFKDNFDEILVEISKADKILLEYAVTDKLNKIR